MKKSGGNGIVQLLEDRAVKTLHSKAREKKARFKKEIEALRVLGKDKIDGIVEILEVTNDSITMKRYNGDLTEIYEEFKGNPKRVMEILLPIVKALRTLSNAKQPIFHRDIKPENILFEVVEGELRLVLSDFGCCFLSDDDRNTPDFRSVGAKAYRAPEYEYGRVESVNEKGDIFSIGKLMWNMINGVSAEVFPYVLWHPKEYNLSNRFPGDTDVMRVNLIIASCTNHEQADRPTYDELIAAMENILVEDILDKDTSKKMQAAEFKAKQKMANIERAQKNKLLFHTFFNDLRDVIAEKIDEYGSGVIDLLDVISPALTRFLDTSRTDSSYLGYIGFSTQTPPHTAFQFSFSNQGGSGFDKGFNTIYFAYVTAYELRLSNFVGLKNGILYTLPNFLPYTKIWLSENVQKLLDRYLQG
ncbi:MAG: protein kinase family protein [Firmicutes bacterium]|nr:protein kinase family protein [Bacillota bacterium]